MALGRRGSRFSHAWNVEGGWLGPLIWSGALALSQQEGMLKLTPEVLSRLGRGRRAFRRPIAYGSVVNVRKKQGQFNAYSWKY